MALTEEQATVVARFAAAPVPPQSSQKLGVASNVKDGLLPLNGLRHRPENETSGWYIWAGQELSEDPDFFQPLHHDHLAEWCAAALPYLALPPGWRLLAAPGYEDVWFDEALPAED